MGIFAQLAERGTWTGSYTLKDPALAELYGYGRQTLAGPIVSEITALTCTAFWDGVQQISADVAKQPLNLHKRRPGDQKGSDIFLSSPTHKLLKFGPNPETRPMVFRRALTAHALIYGNGYAEIVRDGLERPRELWLLHPTRVRPFYRDERSGAPGRSPLRYRIDGETVLEPRDVLHIQGLTDDTVAGISLVGIGREAIGLALASSQFASAFFGNGTRFGGVLTSDQELQAEQRDEIRASVEDMHAKADKAFRLLVLGAGFSFQSTGTTPNDAQMKEIRDQQVAEVARLLNIPVSRLKLNTPGAVSYNSVEMQDLAYYKGPILDWSTVWEQELDAKLVPGLERGRQYFKHNANAGLRGDIKSRYDALGIARDKGIISANEWRELEDMNPQEGDQGDLYLVQSAQVPANRLDEMVDAQVAPDPAPVVEPQPADPPDEPDDQEGDRALEAELAEVRGKLEAAITAHAALEATHDATAEELDARRKDVERLDELRGNLETITAFAKDRARVLEEDLAAATDQLRTDSARSLTVLAAYRDLVLETMGRMVRLEVDGARRKQASQEKVARWLETFPILHRARCLDALTPIIRVHLALTRSAADPAAVAGVLVDGHLEAFGAALAPVLAGERETFHAALEATLETWERGRPGAVADAVIREHIGGSDA